MSLDWMQPSGRLVEGSKRGDASICKQAKLDGARNFDEMLYAAAANGDERLCCIARGFNAEDGAYTGTVPFTNATYNYMAQIAVANKHWNIYKLAQKWGAAYYDENAENAIKEPLVIPKSTSIQVIAPSSPSSIPASIQVIAPSSPSSIPESVTFQVPASDATSGIVANVIAGPTASPCQYIIMDKIDKKFFSIGRKINFINLHVIDLTLEVIGDSNATKILSGGGSVSGSPSGGGVSLNLNSKFKNNTPKQIFTIPPGCMTEISIEDKIAYVSVSTIVAGSNKNLWTCHQLKSGMTCIIYVQSEYGSTLNIDRKELICHILRIRQDSK